ncbi:MAG: DUF4956 domain-containing protein [Clostridiales bacterium GWF2_38_85]|nr:MAG: DUF4956 domain-containing protein [Clostridiales bacterium GWF2_38_85]HBL85276.1 DUF4956 domain-containing protein [Clostridiales bacterium]
MSAKDIIKQSVLELQNFVDTFTTDYALTALTVLLVALFVGFMINLIYTKFYRGVVYNRALSITLIGMTVITAAVTMAISTNIVISLGMVGALSIVRFRTAVKDPLDLLYLFWAITSGIIAGAKMYSLAGISWVIVFLVILIMSKTSFKGKVYIAIIHFTGDFTEDKIKIAMGRQKYRLKSKTTKKNLYELALEIYLKGDSMSFVEKMKEIQGVEDITVIQYDGEYYG